jgi:hypothetical protein
MTDRITINFILEIIGSPKDHVNETIRLVIEQIEDNDDIDVHGKDVSEPEKTDDELFAVFADVNADVEDITTVGHIANNYNPASIELVEPAEITVDRKEFNDLFADTLAKLHINNTQIQELKGFKEDVTRNLNALVRNAVLLSLEQGDKTQEAIADDVGVDPGELDELLDSMIEENRLRRDGDKYTVKV